MTLASAALAHNVLDVTAYYKSLFFASTGRPPKPTSVRAWHPLATESTTLVDTERSFAAMSVVECSMSLDSDGTYTFGTITCSDNSAIGEFVALGSLPKNLRLSGTLEVSTWESLLTSESNCAIHVDKHTPESLGIYFVAGLDSAAVVGKACFSIADSQPLWDVNLEKACCLWT